MTQSCVRCFGKGTYMGNGMMQKECELCREKKHVEPKEISLDNVDRRSKSYKEAIKKIMDLNPEYTKEEATRMFDEAYVKG